MRNNPQANEIYKHFKGNLYRIITLARHSETEEMMVVYQALYGTYPVYVRDLSMFMSEVDHVKYPEVTQKYRFELVLPEAFRPESPKQHPQKASQPETPPQAPAAALPETSQEPVPEAAQEPALDPLLMEFLDADTYREKLNLLAALQPRITDSMINTMAVALDVDINEGSVEERCAALKTCLLTMEKYECSRLR